MADISPLAQAVLSGMLSLIPPGKTIYSQSLIEKCDVTCQMTPICPDPSLLCLPPKFSQEHFNLQLDLSRKEKLTPEQWTDYESEVRLASFVRAETYEEGLRRYAVIAEAISKTTQNLAWRNVNKQCKEECSNAPNSKPCNECRTVRPWTGSDKELATALVTIFNYESGFRKDVHSGVGPLGRGDCKWMDVVTKKHAAPFAKGATPIKGTCRSVCLGQINIGPDVKFGYKADDLVGTDLDSTMRCAEVAGRMLSQARARCSGPNVDYRGDWVAGMFGAYGSGGSCAPLFGTGRTLRAAPYPKQRAGTFWQVYRTTPELSAEVKALLGLEVAPAPLAFGD